MQKILAIRFDRKETFELLVQESERRRIASCCDVVVEKIIALLGLQNIDPTLRHFGTSVTSWNPTTIKFLSVEVDEGNTTDFSHSDDVRMHIHDINKKISAAGFRALAINED